MSKLDEIRSSGSFPGALYNVLVEFEQRLKDLEAHHPMLTSLKAEYDVHLARQAEQEQAAAERTVAASPDSVGTDVEPLDVPGGKSTERAAGTGTTFERGLY